MTERVLITGARGFVGKALVQNFLESTDCKIFAAVRCSHSYIEDRVSNVTIDFTKPEIIYKEIEIINPTVIINTAAYGVRPEQSSLESFIAVNFTGAMHLLEAAIRSDCKRFVHLGSCSEYGAIEGTIKENASTIPVNLYGATKAAASLAIQQRAKEYDLDTLILRLFNIWGENEPEHRLFPSIVNACKTGDILKLTDGEQIKDYSYIGDLVDWIKSLSLIKEQTDIDVVNIGSGNARSLKEFAFEIAKELGCQHLLHFGALKNREGEPRTQKPELEKLTRLLPNRIITPVPVVIERMKKQIAEGSIKN